MARYDNLATQLQNTIYTNINGDISGNTLRDQLIAFINTLGKGSNFMGILSNNNKPTTIPDGKQFYIGYNNSATALSVNLTAVSLGTLSITRNNIYVVYCDDNGWSAVDIASGVSTAIPTDVNQLEGADDLQHKEAITTDKGDVAIDSLDSNRAYLLKDCTNLRIRDYSYNISTDRGPALNLPETHIYVYAADDFTAIISPDYLLRRGDSLSFVRGETYLVTVKGIFWKVEPYA